jgi:acyl-CoA thioesterase FadM
MEKYCHQRDFAVGFCDVDFKDEWKVSKLLSYFEEVACSSADELGFGYDFLKPKGYAFMVTEIKCEFLFPVRLSDVVRVRTWPTPPSYVVFGREYEAYIGERKVAQGTSRWCMVDMNTGKLLSSKMLFNQDYSSYNTARALDDNAKIPKFDFSEGETRFEMTVANSEYDHNMHVNNTRYADYCLNCFNVSELSQKTLKRFAIAYVKQCKEGEKLVFKRLDVDENTSIVCGFHSDGTLVVRSQLVFEKI